MSELSVMGWADVLPRLPKLLWRVRQVARQIVRTAPDVAVLVDSQVFSALVARAVRRRGSRVPLVLYVAPAVWAWKPERARVLKEIFDEVLSVLPFEPSVMGRLGGPPTFYVGHPAVAAHPFRAQNVESGPLVLLPGSRDGELRRHLPLMRALVTRFASHPRISGFVLPTLSGYVAQVSAEVANWSAPVEVVAGEIDKYAAFSRAVAAVAVTGTVTLELALTGVPMVTTYVADRRQVQNWLKYGVTYAALPNILLDRPLVPEILGLGQQLGPLSEALAALLADDGTQTQRTGLAQIRDLMVGGTPEAPPVDPAIRILAQTGP